MKKTSWVLFGFLSVTTGLYPLIYLFIDRSVFLDNNTGFLASKAIEVLSSTLWNISFYGHIIFGGIALLVGWLQFSSKVRAKRMHLHRTIGKIYVLSVLISGPFGLYMAQFANGGIANVIGFTLSGLVWLATTIMAFTTVTRGNILAHEKFMFYSYAVCFSAVTLRIWLPLLTVITDSHETAYHIVAWLSWLPNIAVAHYILKRKRALFTYKLQFKG